MRVKEIPDLLHASVDMSHEIPNMLLDGRHIACTMKYATCTKNTLQQRKYVANVVMMNGKPPMDIFATCE
jgi:hypothetical protein